MRRTELTGNVLDDRYRVIEPIGEGAMGSVYRGERLKLGRIVAIKVLREEIPNEASRQRFEREAMAMAKLEHPNCGSVLDVGVHEGLPYVVMEFVSGQNLRKLIEAGPLPVARAVDITRQVLSGLAHAHEIGIIHRDIKPANIVLSQKSGVGDHVKILDFGLARITHDSSNLTGAMVLGTPNYMAPEQVRGGDIDHRVDLYACGVLLFELLTGVKPFQAADPVAVCMLHINEPAPRLADKAPNREFGMLEVVVARALAKDPRQRFANAEEFSRALVDAAMQVEAGTPARLTPVPPSRPTPVPPSRPTPVPPPAPPLVSSPASAPVLPSAQATQALQPSPERISTDSPVPAQSTGRRTWLFASGGIAAIGVAVAVIVATRSDAKPQQARPPEPVAAVPDTKPTGAPAPEPPPAPRKDVDAVDEIVARAMETLAAGRREAALDLLLDARKTYPEDARLPYHASKVYLDKMWWADGLKQARAAIALDPKYKTDPEIIKLVVKGFNTTKSYDWTLAKFLRDDIGVANAKPYLEDTANNHPNPIVRKRASAELKKHY